MSGKGKNSAPAPKSPGAIGSPFQFSAKAVSASKPKPKVSKVETTRQKFLTLLDALDDQELEEFRDFVREELDFAPDEMELTEDEIAALTLAQEEETFDIGDHKLVEIIQVLRKALPISALAEDEKLTVPKGDQYEGFTEQNTIHVDEFLYTDEETDELVHAGRLNRHVCGQCGSQDIKPLNFISHSLPRDVTRWLVSAVLPNLKDKVLVDVGSRLGPILWFGYLFSHAKQLIGIELNKTFSALSQQIVTDFNFADRVKIINDNILNQAEVLSSGDVVILNNVFEWFTSQEELRNMWAFIVKSITKKGTVVITSPSIEESLAHAQIKDIDISTWVKKCDIRYPTPPPHQHPEGEICGDDDDEDENPFFENTREIHMYEVV